MSPLIYMAEMGHCVLFTHLQELLPAKASPSDNGQALVHHHKDYKETFENVNSLNGHLL